MRNDIVVSLRLYLEFSYLTIFAVALFFMGKQPTQEMAEDELERWKKTGRVPKYMEDFALSVLAKRIVVKWNPKKPQELRLEVADEKKGSRP